jgi:hypothetical protein
MAVNARHPGELGARAVERLLRTLAFAQVDHAGDSLVLAALEARDADEHRDAAAVLAEVLLFERLQGPCRFQLGGEPLLAFEPLRRRDVGPVQSRSDQIGALEAEHVQEGVVRLDDPAPELPDHDTDDVGVDQAPDPRFALGEVAVEASVLEGDRRLRRDELQHRRSRRHEDTRREGVLEVQGRRPAWHARRAAGRTRSARRSGGCRDRRRTDPARLHRRG